MNLSNSPSLNDYKNGIPDQQRYSSSHRKIFRIILMGLLVLLAGMSLYYYMKSDAAALLTGKGSFSGLVLDEQGKPLNAQLSVMGVDRLVQAGIDGSFLYENVPAGKRNLVIIYNGTASEYSVQVQAGKIVNLGQVVFKVVTPSP
jgi:hypothetical protein